MRPCNVDQFGLGLFWAQGSSTRPAGPVRGGEKFACQLGLELALFLVGAYYFAYSQVRGRLWVRKLVGLKKQSGHPWLNPTPGDTPKGTRGNLYPLHERPSAIKVSREGTCSEAFPHIHTLRCVAQS